jgi:hypothetical protein
LFMKKLTRERVGANHLGQKLLGHSRKRAARRLRLTVTREQEKRACQPFLAGVEQVVDQIFFDADVPRQHVRQEPIRERWLGVELPHHFGLVDGQDHGRIHGRRRCHPLQLTGQAALAEEMIRLEHGHHGLFPRVRRDRQAHNA